MVDANVNLSAGFTVRQSSSAELLGVFTVRNSSSQNLSASMVVLAQADLKARFRVERIYNLEGTAGIAFYWWGAANPPEALNQLRLETPTGFWWSDFYDGPARLRYVFIPWGSFTWVSAEQRYLEPHRHGFNEPDKSQIDAFLITIHTTGVRRIDYIFAPLMAYFPCEFVIRRSTSRNLGAGFNVRHATSFNIPAEFIVRHPASADLSAEFEIA